MLAAVSNLVQHVSDCYNAHKILEDVRFSYLGVKYTPYLQHSRNGVT